MESILAAEDTDRLTTVFLVIGGIALAGVAATFLLALVGMISDDWPVLVVAAIPVGLLIAAFGWAFSSVAAMVIGGAVALVGILGVSWDYIR